MCLKSTPLESLGFLNNPIKHQNYQKQHMQNFILFAKLLIRNFLQYVLFPNSHSTESTILSHLLRWSRVSWNQSVSSYKDPPPFSGIQDFETSASHVMSGSTSSPEVNSQNSFIKLTELLTGHCQYLSCLFVKLQATTASTCRCSHLRGDVNHHFSE